MSKALLTGGAGFIGSHLAHRLTEMGYAVDLVDDFSRGSNDDRIASLQRSGSVRLLERDLRRPGALDDADDDYDCIVHLAAIVGVANVVDRPYEVLRDNVSMTEQTLALARRQRALQRFLFTSTSEVYSGTLENFDLPVPTPEQTPLALPDLERPRTTYMLSKLYGEAMCHNVGVPFTIVRPHNVYGPRMGLAHVIPELLQRAHNATDGRLEVFSVEHKRTFCFVDDAVEMIVRSLESPRCEGQTLNVGTQAPEVTIGDLAALIVDVVGRQLEIVPLPATPGSPVRRCPDMSRTAELTGYSSRVALEDGVRRTYEAYRTRVFEPAAAGS
ncbi:MAG: NAD-dependent epimerase/dehydratase family protein [Actinomycetota bacterium]